uniref:Uncharacterized protein n=1 Tax=Arundo donax TaxID=35708 RepID=A0A0A8XR40_ARUDO
MDCCFAFSSVSLDSGCCCKYHALVPGSRMRIKEKVISFFEIGMST